MVISDKYKFLFVELPRTGTTAISKELIENYEGKEILSKHSTYKEFLKIASAEQKNYRVFSCIRNPIDRTVSFYVKCAKGFYDNRFREGYKKRLYDKYYLIPRVKFIKDNKASFDQYLRKFHKWPYTDWSVLDHDKFDHIIRFENLNADFKKVLSKLGIKTVRDLPIQNITTDKKSFELYLNPENSELYIKVFGPALKNLGYPMPIKLRDEKIPNSVFVKYKIIKTLKCLYWRKLAGK